MKHNYTSYSIFKVEVTVTNQVSEVTLETDIATEEDLTEASGQLTFVNDPAAKNSSQINILVGETLTLHWHLNIQTEAWMNISFGDGLNTIVRTDVGSVDHSYEVFGTFNITALVFNNISDITILCGETVSTRIPLHNLLITGTEMVSLPEENYELNITSKGQLFSLNCKFDVSGKVNNKYFAKISEGQIIPLVFNVSTLAVGDHFTNIYCSDGISSANFTFHFLVLEGIRDLTMTLSSNITQVGDTISVFLEVASGTNVSFAASYGNGDLEVVNNVQDGFHIFTYTYGIKGLYMIRCTAANEKDELQTSMIIKVIETLTVKKFMHYSIDLYTGNTYPGTGEEGNKYNLDRKIIIYTNESRHSNLRYSYIVDDGKIQEIYITEEYIFEKKFDQEGNFTINCTVSNDVISFTDTLVIEILRPVKVINFENDGNDVDIEDGQRNVTFNLRIKNPSHNTCLFISIKNYTYLWGETVCQSIYTMQAFIKSYIFVERKIESDNLFSHVFGLNDTDVIEGIGFNQVSRSRIESQVRKSLNLKSNYANYHLIF